MMDFKNITDLKLDGIMKFLTDKTGGNGTIVVCQNDKVLDHFSTPDIKMDSVIVKGPLQDTYTIYLRKDNKKPERLLCHEFVHLSQMLRGDLEIDEGTPSFIWRGIPFDATFPYRWRPWETEAFNKQEKIFREYRKSNKQ